jgi:hypothetical protein
MHIPSAKLSDEVKAAYHNISVADNDGIGMRGCSGQWSVCEAICMSALQMVGRLLNFPPPEPGAAAKKGGEIATLSKCR